MLLAQLIHMNARAKPQFSEDMRQNFLRYTRKKGRKLNKLLQVIMDKQESGAIHGFRKTTRDLQSIVRSVAFSAPSPEIKTNP